MPSREKANVKSSRRSSSKKSSTNSSKKRKRQDALCSTKRVKLESGGELKTPSYPALETHLTTDLYFDLNDENADFGGFLQPLLQADKALDLYKWMIGFNLLKKPEKCLQIDCESSNPKLKWSPLSRDFAWTCEKCLHKVSIRHGSFLTNVKCSIQNALSVVQAWCNQKPCEVFENNDDIKLMDARRIYQVCIDSVNDYITNASENTHTLGGPNSVVLLDIWPNGFLPAPPCNKDTKRKWGDRLRVLWLADTKHVPVRYWAKVLPPLKSATELRMQACQFEMDAEKEDQTIAQQRRKNVLESENDLQHQKQGSVLLEHSQNNKSHGNNYTENKPPHSRQLRIEINGKKRRGERDRQKELNFTERIEINGKKKRGERDRPKELNFTQRKKQEEKDRLEDMVKTAVESAISHIAPSSLVLANEAALPGVCRVLLSSKRYEGVMSVNQLLSVKSKGHRPTEEILKTIWGTGTDVCKQLQNATRTTARFKLVEFLWRQLFDDGGSGTFYFILLHIASLYKQNSFSKYATESEH